MKKMNEDFFANQIARIEYLEIALDILTCTIIRNLGDSFTLEEIQELKTAMAWLSKHQ